MATTTQDQNREKFLELRAQGMSVADARDKSYGPAPTAPVAPNTPATPLVPTPTVTPAPVSPTVNVQEQMAGKTVAERQAIRSGTPTAVAPTAPVAPNTPAPVQNVSDSAPVKQDATPGITQDAFQQAQAKSAEIKAQNDAVMAQNKQKSDLAREDAALAAQAAIPTDKKGIVNAMVTGASIPVQKTEAYNKAVVTSDLFKKYNGMTSDQLFQNLQQGQIGTELSGLLSQNPNFAIAKQKYEQVQKTNAINSLTQATYNAANGKTTPVVDELAKIESKYSAPPGTNAQAYEQFVTQDPDVVKSGLELKNLATQINTVTKTYNDALKSLKEQYPDMPSSALITLMGTRTKDTKELLDSYISAKELAKGDFDLAMKMADGHYNAVSKDIAVQQQEAQQIAQEQRQMQNTLALGQAQFDQKIAQQAQAMNDPTMAISTMIDEYKKLGIPFTRSTQQVISDFQSSGQDLPTYLSELQKLIQSKPEYQRVQAIQQGQLSDREKFSMQTVAENQRDIRNFAQQKELARFNKDLAREQFLFELENDPAQKAKAYELEQKLNANKSLFDVLGKNVGTYEGNRGYDLAGAIGDPLPSGGNWTVKSIDTAGEQVGSIFIGGKGKKPYGNTVVMKDENGNEIRYSHLQNIGVKPGDILGFGDIVGTRGNTGNVKGANGETLTAEQLKAGRGSHLDVEIKNSTGKLLSNADQVTFLKGLKAGGTGISGATLPLYRAYMEDNKLPSKDALAGLGMSSEQFTNNASTGYDQFLRNKEKEINSTYPTLQIEYTPSYSSISPAQREKLNDSMTRIGDIDMRLEKLKKLFDDNGTEVLPTQAKKEMQSLKQQIILKAKEVENLGVLNGPDLGILESLIPETTGIMSGLFSFDDNTKTTLNSIQSNYRTDAKTKGINYGARIGFKGMNESTQVNNPTTSDGQTDEILNRWYTR